MDGRVWYEGMGLDWSGGLKVFGGPFGQKMEVARASYTLWPNLRF